VTNLFHDLWYALRRLRKSPGFTASAITMLAVGIGANTAIFSLLNTVMLRELPVREPRSLVQLLSRYPGEPRVNSFAWKAYGHFRDNNHVFSDLIAVSPSQFQVSADGIEPQSVDGAYISGNFFAALGLTPSAGRLIDPLDDQLGSAGAAVAVLSWQCWKNRFAGDSALLGKLITLNGIPATVIGIAPPDFFGIQVGASPGVWLPAAMETLIQQPSRRADGTLPVAVIGRLKSGASIEQARSEITTLDRWRIDDWAARTKDPLISQVKIEVAPAKAGLTVLRDHFEKPLLVLMIAVGLLLLIACSNLASLLLARGATRSHEMSLRVSLGAGRFRLVRQLLTESFVLCTLGAWFGVYLSYLSAEALARILLSGRPIIGLPPHAEVQVHIDARILLFAAGIAVLTATLAAMAPAWAATHTAPISQLRQTLRTSLTNFHRLCGKTLVVAQVALSVTLLSSATLFIGYLWKLQHLDLGFRRDHILFVTLNASHSGYDNDQMSRLSRQLLDRLQTVAGVRSATLCAPIPISGAGAARFINVGGNLERYQDRRYVSISRIAPKYFETLGIPLIAGRDFALQDQDGPRTAIVNQATARHYFGDKNPIGRQFTIDGDANRYEIVGVAADAKYSEIREAAPRTIYLDAFQVGVPGNFALRTNVDPAAVVSEIRRAVRDLTGAVTVERFVTIQDEIDASIVPERIMGLLSGFLGAIGGVLAAFGLYGLLAYTVACRTTDIGVRMALGATRGEMIRMVLGDALEMTVAGLTIGIVAAYWGNRLAGHVIQDLPVQSAAPVVFAALAMFAVAVLAAYLPARRAAKVDPMVALRYE
jgi:predicted permease